MVTVHNIMLPVDRYTEDSPKFGGLLICSRLSGVIMTDLSWGESQLLLSWSGFTLNL